MFVFEERSNKIDEMTHDVRFTHRRGQIYDLFRYEIDVKTRVNVIKAHAPYPLVINPSLP